MALGIIRICSVGRTGAPLLPHLPRICPAKAFAPLLPRFCPAYPTCPACRLPLFWCPKLVPTDIRIACGSKAYSETAHHLIFERSQRRLVIAACGWRPMARTSCLANTYTATHCNEDNSHQRTDPFCFEAKTTRRTPCAGHGEHGPSKKRPQNHAELQPHPLYIERRPISQRGLHTIRIRKLKSKDYC